MILHLTRSQKRNLQRKNNRKKKHIISLTILPDDIILHIFNMISNNMSTVSLFFSCNKYFHNLQNNIPAFTIALNTIFTSKHIMTLIEKYYNNNIFTITNHCEWNKIIMENNINLIDEKLYSYKDIFYIEKYIIALMKSKKSKEDEKKITLNFNKNCLCKNID